MKVSEVSTMELTRAYWRIPAVADSSRNVWYHCRLRAGGICANSRKSYVPSQPLHPDAELNVVFL
jgi:hypothetical protein